MSGPGNALHAGETAILDLWDQGQTVEQIVERTGRTRRAVFNVLNLYDGPVDKLREAAVRTASIAYGAALIGTGKVYA